MISELTGYTLTRTIPDSVLAGVLSGSYKVFGGVIRNDSGQIVAHLVNAMQPTNFLSSFSSPVTAAFSGFNTFQLYRIGADVQQLIGLAQASMAISGLTLAVSSAGFMFLNNKINKIDKKLEEMAADLKYIKKFLDLQERARLISALRVIRELGQIGDKSTKIQMLINSRQTLGEIHEKYKALLLEDKNAKELMPIEEYFTVTALGHALCSAELGMFDQATNDLLESQLTWKQAAKTFVGEKVLGKDPQRLLAKKYVRHIKSEEIAGWMDFAENCEIGFDRIDQLRDMAPKVDIKIFNSIDKEEEIAIDVSRKLVQRDRILEGYVDQYKYYSSLKKKPSEMQQFFDSLSEQSKIKDCYVFLSNDKVSA
ncbi:hypothetical protein [Marinobacter salsuginis]|uniref:hypothetical protein n=1 Tax=Marinobacter salsuginis TaxID=418719 RepID=UPI00273F2482|nr:hypothetical protein [Marinobacter salsuginis]